VNLPFQVWLICGFGGTSWNLRFSNQSYCPCESTRKLKYNIIDFLQFEKTKKKKKNPLQITFCHNFSMFLSKAQKDVVATKSLVKRITKTLIYFLSFSLSHKDAHACL
jgi:hypothetical protein